MSGNLSVNLLPPNLNFYSANRNNGATASAPQVRSAQIQAAATITPNLGELSAHFESAKPAASAIGKDSTGGWSYGTFQIETKRGTMALFLSSLRTTQPQAYALLDAAGGSAGALKGTKEFKAAWQSLASNPLLQASFAQSQNDFVRTQHYDRLAAKVVKDTGLNVEIRSVALQNVLWSVATQHGPNSTVITSALAGRDASRMSDAQIIQAIYAERSAVDTNREGVKYARYFRHSTPDVQASVLRRFEGESAVALAMLRRESSAAR